ncbi:MAG: hypothetical protein WB709_04450 [Solirubrobacteraceae bacterium]
MFVGAGGGKETTGSVAAELAEPTPPELLALTTARTVLPRSLALSV